MKTISLDLHDFSVLNNRLDLLFKIKEHYPNFKVSMFMIPFDAKYEMGLQRMYREKALEKIKECLDWIQIIPHGLTHMDRELETCDYYLMRDGVIPSIEEAFEKDGLPFEKGFCAPQWLWNEGVIKALDEKGWWGGVDRNQPQMLKTKRYYEYTHSIDEPFWESNNDVLNLHGHIDGISSNDLEKRFTNIFKIPADVEWKFCSEFVKEKV